MYEAQIAKGAALLDEHRPGWENEINLDTLDMHTGNQCMLGQPYGDVRKGAKALDIYDGDYLFTGQTAQYGFAIGRYSYVGDKNVELSNILTQEWKDFITARRAALDSQSKG